MNKKVILLRYGEIHLKGHNRKFFERALESNLRSALEGIECRLYKSFSRYIVDDWVSESEDELVKRLSKVFGLVSLSVALVSENDYEKIRDAALGLAAAKGTFRVNCNRADKTFPKTSAQTAADLGADILGRFPNLTVDLHRPDFVVNCDIRESGTTYLYRETVPCAGGMPVGTAGKGLLLLSGGIDSPVAGHMIAKRGMKLVAVHFFSPPYTSAFAKGKAEDLAKVLSPYNNGLEVFFVPFAKVQEAIHDACDDSFMIIVLRRMMMRVANRLAEEHGLKAIVTGESLGQVASQTVESLTVTNLVAAVPVLRPLIGFDKEEIVRAARRLETFDISIRPYDDCCTVFLPDNPQTRPKLFKVLREEERLDIDALVEQAVQKTERTLF